jgi:hypothetical protein
MSEPKGRYTPLARLGDDGVLLLQCEDCGAVVTHRVVHNRWHDAQPVVDRQGEVPSREMTAKDVQERVVHTGMPNPAECPRLMVPDHGVVISGEVPEPGLLVLPDRSARAVREQMGDAPMAAYLNVDDVSGVARIAAERVRQVQEEGWSQEHDDQHDASELVYGAITYAFAAVRAAAAGPAHVRETRSVPGPAMPYPADLWPLDPNLWKPSDDPIRNLEKAAAAHPPSDWWPWVDDEGGGFKPSPDAIRNLEKAAAMLAAEIDRLVRLRERPTGN